MTYRTLLTRIRNGVAVLAGGTAEGAAIEYDGAQTTRIRYAVKKNRDRLQSEVEHFQELLKEKAEDLGEDAEVLQKVANDLLQGMSIEDGIGEEGVDKEMVAAVQDVLSTETGFEPYTVPEAAMMEEPGVPIAVLDLTDWMVREE